MSAGRPQPTTARRRRCSSWTTSTPTTARSTPCAGSRSTVNQGEVVTLIGANGAGKTTTLKTISGLLHARQGSIRFEGEDITEGRRPRAGREGHRACAGGPPHLPAADRPREPPDGRASADRRQTSSPTSTACSRCSRDSRSGPASSAARCRAASSRCSRSGARSWPSRGSCCSTSHPSASRRSSSRRCSRRSSEINGQGTTVLLVEQNALQALSIAHRGYVLQTGEVVLSGTAESLRQDEMVRKAYLGED